MSDYGGAVTLYSGSGLATQAVGLFTAGRLATPAEARLMMQLGCDGVFVGAEVLDGDVAFDGV